MIWSKIGLFENFTYHRRAPVQFPNKQGGEVGFFFKKIKKKLYMEGAHPIGTSIGINH